MLSEFSILNVTSEMFKFGLELGCEFVFWYLMQYIMDAVAMNCDII